MEKLNSISLLIMGTGFLFLALVMENLFLQYAALFISSTLNIMAIVRSFKEKRQDKL